MTPDIIKRARFRDVTKALKSDKTKEETAPYSKSTSSNDQTTLNPAPEKPLENKGGKFIHHGWTPTGDGDYKQGCHYEGQECPTGECKVEPLGDKRGWEEGFYIDKNGVLWLLQDKYWNKWVTTNTAHLKNVIKIIVAQTRQETIDSLKAVIGENEITTVYKGDDDGGEFNPKQTPERIRNELRHEQRARLKKLEEEL